WGELAKTFTNTIGKGSLILIDGEFRTTSYDTDNKKRQELKFEVKSFKALETPKPVQSENTEKVE
uniref:single-stranded DNA-binding protein n=1 Tax=Aeromonas sp. Ne-1 TaxID=1675689 RepID=UPI001566D5B9